MASEKCSICGCKIHRDGDFGKPTIKGRSHATKHHFVAERFFGRSKNRKGKTRVPIFKRCPWDIEGETAEFCFECHEVLLHNPVLLQKDIKMFAEIVKKKRMNEGKKTNSRKKLRKRIVLLHRIILEGLKVLRNM